MSVTKTKIEWTDKTWGVVRGCSLVSDGCRACYAMKLAHRFNGPGQPYEGLTELGPKGPRWNGKVRLVPEVLDAPLRWRKPARIFVNSMSDLFHEDVPDEFIGEVFAVMERAWRHTFQVLTKRPERMRTLLNAWAPAAVRGYRPWPLPNVWLGVSVENQAAADERIPLLLQTPAAVRWLSCEPLLGPVDVSPWLPSPDGFVCSGTSGDPVHVDDGGVGIDWVVAGGESGPGARPMHPEWARGLCDQCQAASVPFFFKQWGEWFPVVDRGHEDPDWRADYGKAASDPEHFRVLNMAGGCGFHGERVHLMERWGKKKSGRFLDGREWNEYPTAAERTAPRSDAR